MKNTVDIVQDTKLASLKSTWLRTIHTLSLMLLCCLPALSVSEDIDVFFGAPVEGVNDRPNVLFVIDNSGSMGWTDGDDKSRLDELKDVFLELIDQDPKVNIGLATFTQPYGGAIVSAVKPLDGISDHRERISVSASAFDSVDPQTGEPNSAYSDNVSYKSSFQSPATPMIMGFKKGTLSGEQTVESEVTNSDQLLVERRAWGDYDFSEGLDIRPERILFEQGNFVAVRVAIDVPRGATINSARIDFDGLNVSSSNPGTETVFEVVALDANAHQALSLYNTVGEMESANWKDSLLLKDQDDNPIVLDFSMDGRKWGSHTLDHSLDIKELVQPLVKRAQWNNEDTELSVITLMFRHKSGPGRHWFEGTDLTKSWASYPKITVKYQEETGDTYEYATAIRFPEIQVPGGAVVKSARLVLHPNGSSPQEDVGFSVTLANDFGRGPLPKTGTTNTISNIVDVGTNTNWVVKADKWNQGTPWTSNDMSGLMQLAFNRPTWCENKRLTFLIEPNNAAGVDILKFHSTSSGAALFPELHIQYELDPETPITCNNSSVASIGIRGIQDSGYQSSSGSMTVSAQTISLHNTHSKKIGLRFSGIPIEQATTINAAKLILTSSNNNSGSVNLKINVQDTTTAEGITNEDNNISSRSLLANPSATWSINEAWNKDNEYESVDIAPLIQSIVSKGDWSSNDNSIFLVLEPQGAHSHRFYADSAKLEISVPIGSLVGSAATQYNKQVLKRTVNSIRPSGGTPLIDTFHEAAKYFRGDAVTFGKRRVWMSDSYGTYWFSNHGRKVNVSNIETWETGGTVMVRRGNPLVAQADESCHGITGVAGCEYELIDGSPNYISPVQTDCSSNHIVLLTDGAPNYNFTEWLSRGANYMGLTSANSIPALAGCHSDAGPSGERCGRTLAEYLYNNDQVAGKYGSNVHVHTVAFNLNGTTAKNFLNSLATLGGGDSYTAHNATSLATALTTIINRAINSQNTSTKPAVGISIFNKLYHQNTIYYSLFEPKKTAYWPGNIKGYYLKDIGEKDGVYEVVDVNDKLALDKDTGFFANNTKSRWSGSPDGLHILKGGVVEKLPGSSTRKVYSNILGSGPNGWAPYDLTAPENLVTHSNTNLKRSHFGPTATDADRTTAINFMHGVDIKDQNNNGSITDDYLSIGDPLHSSPITVVYDGTDPANADEVIYSTGNDGALRAFNASTGEEMWAFYMNRFLPHQTEFTRIGALAKKLYGMDNTPVMWYNDVNQNGKIRKSEGDKVMLYLTMRRGGSFFAAVDITNKDKPILKWTRKGITDLGDAGPDYKMLGQTWSRPVKTALKIGGNRKEVLIMGAGYASILDQDTDSVTATPRKGNALLIIDATSGAMVAAAVNPDEPYYNPRANKIALKNTDMDYAFAAPPAVIDIDQDGYADQAYIPDVGGQLWRFDFNPEAMNVGKIMTGGIIANLNSEDTGAARRFFSRPDVSIAFSGGQKILAIALGSGEVTRPFNTNIQNRFYVVTQQDVFSAPSEYIPLLENVDIKDVTTGDGTASLGTGGWYIDLDPAEKVYAESITFNRVVMFSTYVPPEDDIGPTCEMPVGKSYFYALRVSRGDAALNLNDNLIIEPVDDRKKLLKQDVPPPGPTMILLEGAEQPLIVVGAEQPLLDMSDEDLLNWQSQFYEYED